MLPEDRETIDDGGRDNGIPGRGGRPEGGEAAPNNDALEAALSLLQPCSGKFGRDALFYEAGRQSALRSAAWRSWTWSAASAGLAAVAAAILVMVYHVPEPQVVVKTVYVAAEQNTDVKQNGSREVESPTGSFEPSLVGSVEARRVGRSFSALGQATTLRGQSERILEELWAPAGSQSQSLARAVDMPPETESDRAFEWAAEPGIPHYRLREQWLN